jgi:hypothetical protein
VGEALGLTVARGEIQQELEQELDAVAVRDARVVDLGYEHQALGVHEQMSLSSFDLLGSYSIAALFAAHARGLERLAIHDGRAGLWGFLLRRTRTRRRRAACILSHVPSKRQERK